MTYKMVLFDVDGTLVISAGAGKRSMSNAFLRLYGIPAFLDYDFVGKTDLGILEQGFTEYLHREPGPGELDLVCRTYLELLESEFSSRGAAVTLLPGVKEALAALTEAGIPFGLATGNLEEGAALKLAPVGLATAFPFGGFGSDSKDRTELTRLALERGRRHCGLDIEASRVLVVGDSILDVRAGHGAGARVLAVGTGWTSREILMAEGADHYLPDLADTRAFLDLLTAGD